MADPSVIGLGGEPIQDRAVHFQFDRVVGAIYRVGADRRIVGERRYRRNRRVATDVGVDAVEPIAEHERVGVEQYDLLVSKGPQSSVASPHEAEVHGVALVGEQALGGEALQLCR